MAPIQDENGFTLIEVLVALAVTSLMLTAVYQTVSSATIAREKLAIANGRHHMARIITERIGRELQSLHFVANDERTRFIGGIGGGDMQLLSFTSTASTPLAKEPGLPARISYQIEPAPESDKNLYQLNRIEKGALTIEEGRPYKLADQLTDIEIRFLGNGSWVSRWDSQTTQTLPDAISLTMISGQDNYKDVFRTTWQVGDF